MTVIAFKVDNRDAEIAALHAEIAALRKEKERFPGDASSKTTNALIINMREKR